MGAEKARKKFDGISNKRSEGSLYSNILYLVLKMRQACNHPWLIENNHLKKNYISNSLILYASHLPISERARLVNDFLVSEQFCFICGDISDYPVISKCGTIYCHQCLISSYSSALLDTTIPYKSNEINHDIIELYSCPKCSKECIWGDFVSYSTF